MIKPYKPLPSKNTLLTSLSEVDRVDMGLLPFKKLILWGYCKYWPISDYHFVLMVGVVGYLTNNQKEGYHTFYTSLGKISPSLFKHLHFISSYL